MKNLQKLITVLLTVLIIIPVMISCNPAKSAVACPDISLRKNEYRAHQKVKRLHTLRADYRKSKKQKINRSAKTRMNEQPAFVPETVITRLPGINKIDFNNALVASTDDAFHPVIFNDLIPFQTTAVTEYENIQDPRCDTIYLKSGGILIGKVEEIGQSELKYRKCDNLTGPVISILKSNVSRINYPNGTSDVFGPIDTPIQNYSPNPANLYQSIAVPPKNEGLGVAGFISGLVGLLVAAIPLGIVATVFGAVSLSKINRNPMKYKGRGLAIASIVLGIFDVVVMIVLMAAVL